MSEFDTVIRNGTVVEATGIPAYRADVGIKNGKIAQISGSIKGSGAKELDATGCIVAPGAVEQHAHYDGQINWDPYCSLSGWHGMTSMTIGHCGYGVAPVRPEDREANMQLHSRIEAIPLHSMRAGIRWDWITFPEYLDSLQRQGVGVNVGAMFAYSPARVWVMGAEEAANRAAVTKDELDRILALFREALDAGAFGFSLNKNMADRPATGGYLPTHVAADLEFESLARVLGEYGLGGITMTLGSTDDEGRDMLVEKLAKASGRPVQFAALNYSDQDPGLYKKQLAWVEGAKARGLSIYGQSIAMPIDPRFKLSEFNLLDDMPNWFIALLGTREERIERLQRKEIRDGMKRDIAEWEETDFHKDWSKLTVLETVHERNYKYDGMSIAEIAASEGKDPVDAWLDLSLDEGLETEFSLSGLVGGERRGGRRDAYSPADAPVILGWRRPCPVLHNQHLADLPAEPLGARRRCPYTGAGPLQDECPARLAGRVPGQGHPPGRHGRRHHRLQSGRDRLRDREARVCHQLPGRREEADTEAQGNALHHGQRHRDFRGEQVPPEPCRATS